MAGANEQNWKPSSVGKKPIVLPRGHGGHGSRWECARCRKLLGIIDGGRVHLSYSHGPECIASFPVTCGCRKCGYLNEYPLVPGSTRPVTHN